MANRLLTNLSVQVYHSIGKISQYFIADEEGLECYTNLEEERNGLKAEDEAFMPSKQSKDMHLSTKRKLAKSYLLSPDFVPGARSIIPTSKVDSQKR